MNFKYFLLLWIILFQGAVFSQSADFTAAPTTICVGGSVQFTDASVGAASYSWTFVDGTGGQTSTIQNPLITYSTPGTFAVVLTIANGGLSDTEFKSAFITVLATATATLTSASGSDNQTVCLGDALTSINYAIQGATGATFSGLPPGVVGSFNPTASGGNVVISGTPTALGTYPFSFTTNGISCGPITVNGTITVQSSPTLTLTSGSGNPSVCLAESIAPIAFSVGGSAIGASVSGLPAGMNGSFSAGTFTLSGTPSVSGTFPYTVTTTGGACPPETFNGTITVVAQHTLGLTSAVGTVNQTVCLSSPIADITYAVGGSATGATITGLPSGINGTFNAGVFTISGTSSTVGSFPFTVETTGTPCTSVSATGTITISAAPTLSLTSSNGNQSVCLSAAIVPITFSVGGSATGASVSGLPTGINGNFSAGTFTITGTPSAVGAFPYTVTTTGGVCPPVTFSGTITVEDQHTINLSSAAGTNTQTVCLGAPIANITYVVGGSATGAIATGLPAGVSGTFNAGVFTISGTSTTTGNFPFTVETTGTPCTTVSTTGTLTVADQPTVQLTSAPATNNQVVCLNDLIVDITYAVGGSATGATVSGLPSGVVGSFSGGVFTITGSPTLTGSLTYTITTTGGPCVGANATGVLNVGPELNLISPASTANQTVCEDSSLVNIVYSVDASTSGISVSGLPNGVTGTFSGGVYTISGSPLESGVFTYTITTTGGPCNALSATGTIMVNPGASLTLQSAGTNVQTVCQFDSIVPIIYNLGGSATGANVIGLPPGIIAAVDAGTLTIDGASSTSGNFPFTISTTGSICGETSVSGSLQVDPAHELQLLSLPATENQTLCLNTAFSTLVYAISGGATDADVINLPAGLNFIVQNDSVIISGTPTQSGNQSFTVFTIGNGCSVDSANVSLNVDISASLTLISASTTSAQVVCEEVFIDTIMYVLSPGADTAMVFGLETDFFANFLNDTLVITGNSNSLGVFPYFVVAYGVFCPNDTVFGTIEVQNTQLVLGSAFGTNDQTVFLGDTIESIAYVASGPVLVNDLPPGLTANFIAGSPSVLTITGTPSQTGSYYYSIQLNGLCGNLLLIGDITVLAPEPIDSTLFVPNLFSPNADGYNDFFEIVNLDLNPGTGLTVINREGSVVYENEAYDNSWGGTFNDNPLPDGTYYYVLQNSLTDKVIKGSVTILRNKK